MFNIIFFGPPGAGKGTQAKLIAKEYSLPHLSTGDILRSKINQEDELAIKLKKILASGKLVSDDILNSIVAEKLKYEGNNGFILDGYPRTLNQSTFLNNLLKNESLIIDFVINIDIELEILESRIVKRSLEENREDDNINVFKTRYSEYIQTTKKVSDYYSKIMPDKFHLINGNDEIKEITSKIIKILKNSWKTANFHNIFTWLKH